MLNRYVRTTLQPRSISFDPPSRRALLLGYRTREVSPGEKRVDNGSHFVSTT